MAGFFQTNNPNDSNATNANDESILGAIQKAGTTYNTLKNMDLKQVIKNEFVEGDDAGEYRNVLFNGPEYAPPSAAYSSTRSAISNRLNVLASNSNTVKNNTPTSTINIQPAVQGFGSYLDGILPPDIATAAGAFSASMQQIKNISSIPIEKFAQVVTNLETTKGLNVNGTSVPTDTTLAQQGLALIALGNGPFGTYTMSNFLGCMSGLPYLGINVRQLIQELETTNLYTIYRNLYLAVTWEQATATWNGTSFTYTDRGGGYGRGTSAPSVTVGGNPATAIIGTDPTDLTTFGRLISITYSGAAGAVVIAPPPGGGFPTMNTIIQGYIDDANDEIESIKNNNPSKAQQLITNWELTGTLLSGEQRAIATGLPIRVPNSSPDDLREPTLAGYPSTQYTFVDSIPQYATFTQPNMYSQTLEAIADLNTIGGRSLVGMLRQARNQNRLTEIGVPLDNNIDDKLTKKQESQLIANGTLAGSIPASLQTELGSPTPFGYYDDADNRYYSDGVAVDTGQADEPGSFAGSRYQNLISPELSVIYASDVLLPSTYSVQEAIDEVIRCNCDCWDNI